MRETFKGIPPEESVGFLLKVIEQLDGHHDKLMNGLARMLRIAHSEGRIDSILVLYAMTLGAVMHEGEWLPLLKAGRSVSDGGYKSDTERSTRNRTRDKKMAREFRNRQELAPQKSDTAIIREVGIKYGLGKSAARDAIMRGLEDKK
jgi:hypothetical protein